MILNKKLGMEEILFNVKDLIKRDFKVWKHDKFLFDGMLDIQLGRRKNDPVKDRKALETYVSLRGYKQGGTGSNQYMQTCQNGTSANKREIVTLNC